MKEEQFGGFRPMQDMQGLFFFFFFAKRKTKVADNPIYVPGFD
jgi:hypothetical protein